MIVAIISPEKAEELTGKEYTKGMMFNPVPYHDAYCISFPEAQYLRKDEIIEIVDYVPEVEEIEEIEEIEEMEAADDTE